MMYAQPVDEAKSERYLRRGQLKKEKIYYLRAGELASLAVYVVAVICIIDKGV